MRFRLWNNLFGAIETTNNERKSTISVRDKTGTNTVNVSLCGVTSSSMGQAGFPAAAQISDLCDFQDQLNTFLSTLQGPGLFARPLLSMHLAKYRQPKFHVLMGHSWALSQDSSKQHCRLSICSLHAFTKTQCTCFCAKLSVSVKFRANFFQMCPHLAFKLQFPSFCYPGDL